MSFTFLYARRRPASAVWQTADPSFSRSLTSFRNPPRFSYSSWGAASANGCSTSPLFPGPATRSAIFWPVALKGCLMLCLRLFFKCRRPPGAKSIREAWNASWQPRRPPICRTILRKTNGNSELPWPARTSTLLTQKSGIPTNFRVILKPLGPGAMPFEFRSSFSDLYHLLSLPIFCGANILLRQPLAHCHRRLVV